MIFMLYVVGSTPQGMVGPIISDDGRWLWNGKEWIPNPSRHTNLPHPPMPLPMPTHNAQQSATGKKVSHSKSPIPVGVGVIFVLHEVLVVLTGLLMIFLGTAFGEVGGEEGDAEMASLGVLSGMSGVISILVGLLGIYAGVMIALRKKIGVYIAWFSLAISTILTLWLNSRIGEGTVDWASLIWVAFMCLIVSLPLIIPNASRHME